MNTKDMPMPHRRAEAERQRLDSVPADTSWDWDKLVDEVQRLRKLENQLASLSGGKTGEMISESDRKIAFLQGSVLKLHEQMCDTQNRDKEWETDTDREIGLLRESVRGLTNRVKNIEGNLQYQWRWYPVCPSPPMTTRVWF